jgi:hypothetical protein
MKKLSLNNKGFGLVGALLLVLVLAVAGGAGAYVYHKNHKAKNTTTTSSKSDTGNSSKMDGNSSTSTAKTDPYAGWKTYTDTTYHYSFRYPAGWTVTGNANMHGVRLLSPTQTVSISYGIGQPQSDATLTLTPSSITKLASANEDLTVVGGYVSANNQVSPLYQVVDSSLLSKYPLAVGKASQFPTVPSFTVKGTSYLGLLAVAPVNSITTMAGTQTWLDSTDAKTSLMILESLSYQQ